MSGPKRYRGTMAQYSSQLYYAEQFERACYQAARHVGAQLLHDEITFTDDAQRVRYEARLKELYAEARAK